MKLRKNQKIWAEIEILSDGKLKVVRADKYVSLNQHRNKWVRTDARNIARLINNGNLVIN